MQRCQKHSPRPPGVHGPAGQTLTQGRLMRAVMLSAAGRGDRERYPAGLEGPACPVPCGRGPSLDLVIHPGIQESPPQTRSGTDSSREGWFPPAFVTVKVRFSLWGRCEFDMDEPKDSKQLGKANAPSPAEGPIPGIRELKPPAHGTHSLSHT